MFNGNIENPLFPELNDRPQLVGIREALSASPQFTTLPEFLQDQNRRTNYTRDLILEDRIIPVIPTKPIPNDDFKFIEPKLKMLLQELAETLPQPHTLVKGEYGFDSYRLGYVGFSDILISKMVTEFIRVNGNRIQSLLERLQRAHPTLPIVEPRTETVGEIKVNTQVVLYPNAGQANHNLNPDTRYSREEYNFINLAQHYYYRTTLTE